ncbi:neuronal PAS domain-containing protein 1 isoform X5 [Hippopotamus amphibius kiboko]|uniref:neuronal PAS domain-containing protein 1 isoform X5 n=1 Tax=Hippopotamus amphibius kiboko TaxID=575201 RepID=UPI00259578FB|nr:neuronal PAS domain-containing protein 1 isoform X5 [Hippopotamus amphibius kiboko]
MSGFPWEQWWRRRGSRGPQAAPSPPERVRAEMAAPYPGSGGGGGEVRCGGGRGGSVPWDFLPGFVVKAPPGPCLQAQRKEKSRNAARSRRGKENLEFFELAKLLPLPGAISSQLDKASIVRLSVTYLRLRRFAALGAPPWGLRSAGPPAGLGTVLGAGDTEGNRTKSLPLKVGLHTWHAPGHRGPVALVSEIFEQHLGGHILQSLDGFVFALNQEGKFLYISETVSIYLGLSQVELTGSSVFDYIHPGDHSEVLEQLGLRAQTPGPPTPPSVPSSSSSSSSSSSLAETPEIEASPTEVSPSSRVQERSFFIRMKSTLTKRGLHVKASGYKVIHVTGRLRARALGLVALGHALPPAPLAELPLHGHMIVFRLSLGLTILACESSAPGGSCGCSRWPPWLSAGRALESATCSGSAMCSAKLRGARHLWTPSNFRPAWPPRMHPAQSQSPRSQSLQGTENRPPPWRRTRPPSPGANPSKWSLAPGRRKTQRTVGTRSRRATWPQRGPSSRRSSGRGP